MVFKNKLSLLIFIFSMIILNTQANIIYDKNNIIITEIDLDYYKKLHSAKFDESINNPKALKNLVIIKKLINNLERNNYEYLKKIDLDISNEIDVKSINSEIIFDIIRYLFKGIVLPVLVLFKFEGILNSFLYSSKQFQLKLKISFGLAPVCLNKSNTAF